jgi:hypothetical protein
MSFELPQKQFLGHSGHRVLVRPPFTPYHLTAIESIRKQSLVGLVSQNLDIRN